MFVDRENRRLRFSSDADIVRLTNGRIITIIIIIIINKRQVKMTMSQCLCMHDESQTASVWTCTQHSDDATSCSRKSVPSVVQRTRSKRQRSSIEHDSQQLEGKEHRPSVHTSHGRVMFSP